MNRVDPYIALRDVDVKINQLPRVQSDDYEKEFKKSLENQYFDIKIQEIDKMIKTNKDFEEIHKLSSNIFKFLVFQKKMYKNDELQKLKKEERLKIKQDYNKISDSLFGILELLNMKRFSKNSREEQRKSILMQRYFVFGVIFAALDYNYSSSYNWELGINAAVTNYPMLDKTQLIIPFFDELLQICSNLYMVHKELLIKLKEQIKIKFPEESPLQFIITERDGYIIESNKTKKPAKIVYHSVKPAKKFLQPYTKNLFNHTPNLSGFGNIIINKSKDKNKDEFDYFKYLGVNTKAESDQDKDDYMYEHEDLLEFE